MLRFTTNDPDENPYLLLLKGRAFSAPEPEITVWDGEIEIIDGSVIEFGSTLPGKPVGKMFTIRNTGAAPLTLGDLTLPAGFALASEFPVSLDPDETGDFQIVGWPDAPSEPRRGRFRPHLHGDSTCQALHPEKQRRRVATSQRWGTPGRIQSDPPASPGDPPRARRRPFRSNSTGTSLADSRACFSFAPMTERTIPTPLP